MQTHYLGKEEVEAYLKDLAERLQAEDAEFPNVWCYIGDSGEALARTMLSCCDFAHEVQLLRCDYDRDSQALKFSDGSPAKDLPRRNVMVLDSSVHSGHTIQKVVQEVRRHKPRSLCTYTLVLKRGAAFIPHFWGVTIGDHDRAYFLLDKIPNNRLEPTKTDIHLRRLSHSDLQRPPVRSRLKSLNHVTWADRYFDSANSDETRFTYVVEKKGTIVGYLTVAYRRDTELWVDEIAVDKRFEGQGIAGMLLRWAETCGRQADCRDLHLWAYKPVQRFYEKSGYEAVPSRPPIDLGDETYVLMQKKIIDHL